MKFSEGLERIEVRAFCGTGIEDIVLPSSTRVIDGYAFSFCKKLHSIRLNDGLEILGTEKFFHGTECKGKVFAYTALENIAVPSTVRIAEC